MFVMHVPSTFYKFTKTNKYIKYPIGYLKNIWIGNLYNNKLKCQHENLLKHTDNLGEAT